MSDSQLLTQFPENLHIAIIGASGGIGRACIDHLIEQDNVASICAYSRSEIDIQNPKVSCHSLDLTDENSIINAAIHAKNQAPFDLIFITTGFLHNTEIKPEKSLKDLNLSQFQHVFNINTFGPALGCQTLYTADAP